MIQCANNLKYNIKSASMTVQRKYCDNILGTVVKQFYRYKIVNTPILACNLPDILLEYFNNIEVFTIFTLSCIYFNILPFCYIF